LGRKAQRVMLADAEAPVFESPGADRGLRSQRGAAARARHGARVRREGALPYVEQYEREERYPLEQIRKLPALGLMGPLIPERYGGSKSDVVTYGIICEELARADWVVASVVSVSNSLSRARSCAGATTRRRRSGCPRSRRATASAPRASPSPAAAPTSAT
jgi:alkylation response protein AidB-like acyl-CoA dehydrogenase